MKIKNRNKKLLGGNHGYYSYDRILCEYTTDGVVVIKRRDGEDKYITDVITTVNLLLHNTIIIDKFAYSILNYLFYLNKCIKNFNRKFNSDVDIHSNNGNRGNINIDKSHKLFDFKPPIYTLIYFRYLPTTDMGLNSSIIARLLLHFYIQDIMLYKDIIFGQILITTRDNRFVVKQITDYNENGNSPVIKVLNDSSQEISINLLTINGISINFPLSVLLISESFDDNYEQSGTGDIKTDFYLFAYNQFIDFILDKQITIFQHTSNKEELLAFIHNDLFKKLNDFIKTLLYIYNISNLNELIDILITPIENLKEKIQYKIINSDNEIITDIRITLYINLLLYIYNITNVSKIIEILTPPTDNIENIKQRIRQKLNPSSNGKIRYVSDIRIDVYFLYILYIINEISINTFDSSSIITGGRYGISIRFNIRDKKFIFVSNDTPIMYQTPSRAKGLLQKVYRSIFSRNKNRIIDSISHGNTPLAFEIFQLHNSNILHDTFIYNQEFITNDEGFVLNPKSGKLIKREGNYLHKNDAIIYNGKIMLITIELIIKSLKSNKEYAYRFLKEKLNKDFFKFLTQKFNIYIFIFLLDIYPSTNTDFTDIYKEYIYKYLYENILIEPINKFQIYLDSKIMELPAKSIRGANPTINENFKSEILKMLKKYQENYIIDIIKYANVFFDELCHKYRATDVKNLIHKLVNYKLYYTNAEDLKDISDIYLVYILYIYYYIYKLRNGGNKKKGGKISVSTGVSIRFNIYTENFIFISNDIPNTNRNFVIELFELPDIEIFTFTENILNYLSDEEGYILNPFTYERLLDNGEPIDIDNAIYYNNMIYNMTIELIIKVLKENIGYGYKVLKKKLETENYIYILTKTYNDYIFLFLLDIYREYDKILKSESEKQYYKSYIYNTIYETTTLNYIKKCNDSIIDVISLNNKLKKFKSNIIELLDKYLNFTGISINHNRFKFMKIYFDMLYYKYGISSIENLIIKLVNYKTNNAFKELDKYNIRIDIYILYMLFICLFYINNPAIQSIALGGKIKGGTNGLSIRFNKLSKIFIFISSDMPINIQNEIELFTIPNIRIS